MLRAAWRASSAGDLLLDFAHALQTTGIPVSRVALIVRTLHPQVLGTLHRWDSVHDSVRSVDLAHDVSGEESFLSSPFIPIFEGRGCLRRSLEGDPTSLDYPILRELHSRGATDYAALPVIFGDGQIHALTLSTHEPGGFRQTDLDRVEEIVPLLGRLIEVHALRRTARTLLDTYLGVGTGLRVLQGRIRRGDEDRIPAVVWMADLRGSTSLQEGLDRDRYLELLNAFFESTAGAAIEAGGEVLKFIGDAVLAIFPMDQDPDAAVRALAAARAALASLGEYNTSHAGDCPKLAMALALHLGEVHYGNIGVPGRLDFTVTGPVVNEVSRIEGLCKQLGKPVLVSEGVAAIAPGELVSLGHHELRGIARRVEVFTLPELA
ncbi:adenylate cyclase [Myxococcaceae bacterium]|nr:adenylate cyclase [Myxococcaceae bacterium]